MSVASSRRVMRIRGALCINPTDLTTSFPHGGTAIGLGHQLEFRFGMEYFIQRDASIGKAPTEVYYTGIAPMIGGFLRDYDKDALGRLFPNVGAAGFGPRLVKFHVKGTGITRPGAALGANAVKLCFSPRADGTHPWILMYKAVPVPEIAGAMALSAGKEGSFPVVFIGLPDSDGKVAQMGDRAEVALS